MGRRVLAEPGRHLVRGALVDVRDDDAGPLGDEQAGRRRADAPRSPGDDGDLAP
jgi:hypothetical protein